MACAIVRWSWVCVVLAGCPVGDDEGDDGATSVASSSGVATSSDGTDAGSREGSSSDAGGDGDGGSSTCSTSSTATVCGEVLAAWLQGTVGEPTACMGFGGGGDSGGPGDGSSGGRACGTDPVSVDDTEALATVCLQVCGSCGFGVGPDADDCMYLGEQSPGEHAFRCRQPAPCE